MKTFFQLREETTGRTLKVSKDIYEAATQMMNEETDHGFGYGRASTNAAKKGLKAAHSGGLKINHGDQGNTPGSKPHSKPDVTVHYEMGDEPHRDSPSGVTLHSAKAKSHPSADHFKKSEQHAEKEEEY